ncbi:hypothetical protein DXA13_11035 [Clostridium sp. AM58-1XD]|nr:hypothetical protein DXA13_11035 [Clostridium sp. AM58-1XD]
MPLFMWNIIYGYCIIKIYHFVTLKRNSNNIEHVLINSFVVGFLVDYFTNIAEDIFKKSRYSLYGFYVFPLY